jgi:hypothetical protein
VTIHRPLLLAVSAVCLAALACSLMDNTTSAGDILHEAEEILPEVEQALPEIAEALPVTDNVLFSDDFSSTSSGWDQEDYGTGTTDYLAGTYQILVEEENFDYWANPGLSFTDVVVDVDTTRYAGPADNDFGVICRYQDVENFYALVISSDGMYAIYRNQSTEMSILGQESMIMSDAINTNTSDNHITASCVGSTLTLSVNGQQLAQVTDATFTSGDVGLLAGTFDTPGVDIRFDNFVVTKP